MATVALGPAPLDITGIRAGDRNQISMTLNRKGVPLDLTGMDITAQARKTSTDDTAINAVVENRDDLNGTFTIRWPGDDVTELLDGAANWKGVWDIQVQSPGEDPVTVAAGKFAAEMDVTRPQVNPL